MTGSDELCPDCKHPVKNHRKDAGGCDNCEHVDWFGNDRKPCTRQF